MINSSTTTGSIVLCMAFCACITPVTAEGLGRNCADNDTFSLAVHGGAVWGFAPRPAKEAFIEQQLRIGRERLAAGNRSLNVVEAVVAAMEDSGIFNAGKGSVANQAGEIEMDASIMDGRHLRAGAVASVRELQNPISAARQVMDDTPYVMMAGPAADAHLAKAGATRVEQSYFLNSGRNFSQLTLPADVAVEKPAATISPEVAGFSGVWGGVLGGQLNHVLVVRKLDERGADVVVAVGANESLGISKPTTLAVRARFLNRFLVVSTPSFRIAYLVSGNGQLQARLSSAGGGRATGLLSNQPDLITNGGTVGAVARDRCGNLAAGTSTGGFGSKIPGRVGDSPIIGAGTYADNRSAAISATGHGEYFIRHAVAHEIAARIRHGGETLVQAAYRVVFKELQNSGGKGGIIAIDKTGKVEMLYNTDGMVRGWTSDLFPPRVATYPND